MADQQGYGGPPGAPSPGTGFPANTGFVNFEVFETLNTKPTRPAIKDSEMSWCDGFMPFGPSNLRVLPDVGDSVYTAPMGTTITAMWFYNFSDSTYAAVLLSTGALIQVDLTTLISTTILSAGTITTPDPHNTSVTQWNSKYLVIVSTQDNGFWIWDGSHSYTSGTISPDVTVTNSGENYTSNPTFNFQTTATSFVAPTFSATRENGFITEVNVLTPGSGFKVTDFVHVALSGGGSDTTARATATISSSTGPVIGITYTGDAAKVPATANIRRMTDGGGTGATAALSLNNGVITSIQVLQPGSGYTSPPTVFLDDASGKTGNFSALAEIGYGEISAINVVTGGTNYTSPPIVTILGDGQGATAVANLNSSKQVASITVTNGGYGYTKVLVVLSGGNNAAEVDVELMPFGIQGTTVETYVNRIWVGDTRKGYFTAPSSVSDFKPSDGAGAFQSNDSFQRVAYHSFKQTNGFLYLISDSSINYIGGVQTTGLPATTVFNNLNVDPQIGTPWPSTVQLFSRNLVFANSFGIFVSYGGAVAKISTPLDGIYNTVITPGAGNPLIFPSSAVASLFGIAVYMLLFPIIDPITKQQVNKLLIWDGKRWWTSNQGVSLTYVASQEVNSVLTAWGTDGTHLYPLFQTPSTNFTKVAQSKLWANPSYWFRKTNPYVAGIINFFSTDGKLTITVDNETGSQEVSIDAFSSGTLSWTNNSGAPMTWTNNSGDPIIWVAPGLALVGPELSGQVGTLMGFTITTTGADLSILSLSLLEQNYQDKV